MCVIATEKTKYKHKNVLRYQFFNLKTLVMYSVTCFLVSVYKQLCEI